MNQNPDRASRLRIIGGQWRGRRLMLPVKASTRPTPARLRETLFNWLHYRLDGRRCLDLFAGSGALSFEALSRGASVASLVDSNACVCATLKRQNTLLGAGQRTTVVHSTAQSFLTSYGAQQATPPFDLVFVDPPFNSHLLNATLALVVAHPRMLSEQALIYIEHPKQAPLTLPEGWVIERQATAATVAGTLLGLARRIIQSHDETNGRLPRNV